LTVDGRAGILAFDHNGNSPLKNGIIGAESPLNHYYAYGIRNGFGLDFDPITGKLWDTENGPTYGDEINLVEPGFNSGWAKTLGFWTTGDNQTMFLTDPNAVVLKDFNGKGKFSFPELAWNQTIAPTGIKFFNSDQYGKKYKNDIFVGSNIGVIYHFDLNSERTGLALKGPLKDKIVQDYEDEALPDVIFGKNFNVISDVTVGPDGYLYVVSLGKGEIYRIVPADKL